MQATGVTGTTLDGVLTEEQQARWNARQLLSVKRILTYWEEHGFGLPYPMLAAATGFGKGRVIAKLIERVAEILKKPSPDPTLLIAGTKNLLAEQAVTAVSRHLGNGSDDSELAALVEEDTGAHSFAILGRKGAPKDASVNVAIWQGLAALERRDVLQKAGLIVVDEGHNTGVKARIDLLEALQKDAVVGLTATAFRSSGRYRAPESYGFQIVDTVPLTEGIDEGWNSPLIGIPIDPGYILPAEVREGDNLNTEKLAVELRKHPEYLPNAVRLLAEVFLKSSNGKPGPKAIIPVNRVEDEAVAIARLLRDYGYAVGLAVNQRDAKKWEKEFPTFDAIERHRLPREHADSIQVLISPAVIGEGYDNPAIELIAWMVPTISGLRYTQVLGRGTRACPGKAHCLVVDFPWFIEGYGYSTTLAQFFPKEDLQELEDGRYFIGPMGQDAPNLGGFESLEKFGKVVRLVDLIGAPPLTREVVTLQQIARAIKKSLNLTEAILREEQFSPTKRRYRGAEIEAYPREALDAVQELLANQVTLEAVSEQLGISSRLLKQLMSTLNIKERRDKGAESWTISKSDIELMEAQLQTLVRKGNWLERSELCQLLNWIEEDTFFDLLILHLDIKSEERLTGGSELDFTTCYPPESLQLIRKTLRAAPMARKGQISRHLIQKHMRVGSADSLALACAMEAQGCKPKLLRMPGGEVDFFYPSTALQMDVEAVRNQMNK